MKRSRFTEEQIIGILREQEAGVATAEVCRRHGVSSATFYKWKAKFGGMDVSEARRLKALEDENTKLKRMLADAMLDNVAENIQGRTICALGDAAAMPVRAFIKHYRDEFVHHIEHKTCMVPAYI